jgi:hypothetical protein
MKQKLFVQDLSQHVHPGADHPLRALWLHGHVTNETEVVCPGFKPARASWG